MNGAWFRTEPNFVLVSSCCLGDPTMDIGKAEPAGSQRGLSSHVDNTEFTGQKHFPRILLNQPYLITQVRLFSKVLCHITLNSFNKPVYMDQSPSYREVKFGNRVYYPISPNQKPNK